MAVFDKDSLSEQVIGLCFRIHTELGPGFPEKIDHNALVLLLTRQQIAFETEKEFNVMFDGRKVGTFRCDLVIESKLMLELKAVTGG